MVMPTVYGRPGIYVTEQLSGPNVAPSTTASSAMALAGEHWRGPGGVAVLCSNWSEFLTYFGGFNPNPVPQLTNPYLPYAVHKFFANGGSDVWVQRILSSTTPGAPATLTLYDTNTATPQSTLVLTAGFQGTPNNVGTWGNALAATVTQTALGYFNLALYYGGTTAANLVESWVGLTMNPTDPRYAPAVLNAPNTGSAWVMATDQFSAAGFPDNTPLPIVAATFTGGVDSASPSASDRANAVTLGTSPYDLVSGALTFNMPGESTASVVTAAVTYATQRPYTFVVLDPPPALTVDGVVTYEEAISPAVPNAALYYPWLTATNPASSNVNGTISLPPGSFVLGQMARSDRDSGVWYAPAGVESVLAGVVQAAATFSPQSLSTLNMSNVNALRTRPNKQVVIWGTRTLAQGYATLYVPVQRTLNYIESALSSLIDFATFSPNDPVTWGAVSSACSQFLDSLLGAGAFPASTATQAYYVTCNATNNTPTLISQGILTVGVGVALQIPAEFIALTISQFQTTGLTTVTAAS